MSCFMTTLSFSAYKKDDPAIKSKTAKSKKAVATDCLSVILDLPF